MALNQLQRRLRLKVYPIPGRTVHWRDLGRTLTCAGTWSRRVMVALERSRFRDPRIRWGNAKGLVLL
jgi:hypothetical protein